VHFECLGWGGYVCGWLVGWFGVRGAWGIRRWYVLLEMMREKRGEMRVIIYFRRSRAVTFNYIMLLAGFFVDFAMWHGGWDVLWYRAS
jgi:hypothetical protein